MGKWELEPELSEEEISKLLVEMKKEIKEKYDCDVEYIGEAEMYPITIYKSHWTINCTIFPKKHPEEWENIIENLDCFKGLRVPHSISVSGGVSSEVDYSEDGLTGKHYLEVFDI